MKRIIIVALLLSSPALASPQAVYDPHPATHPQPYGTTNAPVETSGSGAYKNTGTPMDGRQYGNYRGTPPQAGSQSGSNRDTSIAPIEVTRPATYQDVVNLWGNGSCQGFLRYDGTCAEASGGGGGGISGLTAGYIPLAGSSTTLTSDSHLNDGVTTPSVITSSETIAAPALATTGGTPGYVSLSAGTGNLSTLPSSSAGFAAPSGGGTPYLFKLPPSATAGVLHSAAPATIDGVNESAISTAPVNLNNEVSGVLPVANGGSAPVADIQIVLPTSPIAANTCTPAVTATMTGLSPTATFTTAFASNPTLVHGWGATGGLTFAAWPSANTINWSVCNQTNTSITPGAMTLNVGTR
jgi:hypothetical protein